MEKRTGSFSSELLEWYDKNGRQLPWRETSDPYKIWISEIMLQQTRVDTVIDYYRRFLGRFPDIRSLAEAQEGEVLSAWKGLGYYSRARNLHEAARRMMERHGGSFPGSFEEIRALPGIGDYTAGAVISIAFQKPCAAVDGNVLRVISRVEGLMEDISSGRAKKTITSLVSTLIPEDRPGDFTQALMELGALVCVPGEPDCPACPVRAFCNAYATGRQRELPVKKKSDKPVPEFHFQVAVIRQGDSILLEHRREETLLSQLWGFPMVEWVNSGKSAAGRSGSGNTEILHAFIEKYGLHLQPDKDLGCTSHVFTHRKWVLHVTSFLLLPEGSPSPTLHWVTGDQAGNLAIPTAFQKVFDLILCKN